MEERKEKKEGKTFYRSVAVGTMTMGGEDVEAIERNWSWAVAAGVIMAVVGLFAVIYPAVTTMGVVVVLGIALLVGAVMQLIHSFTVGRVSGFFWHLFIALVYAVVGVMLLAYPLGGLVTLTLLLAGYFLVSGLSKIAISLTSRDTKSWGWMLASGILSVILGVLVWVSWPTGSLWFIGLVVGIDLFFGGVSLAITASSIHSMVKNAEAEM